MRRSDKVASYCGLHGAVTTDETTLSPRNIPTSVPNNMNCYVADDTAVSVAEDTVTARATDATDATYEQDAAMRIDLEDVDDIVGSDSVHAVTTLASVAAVTEVTDSIAVVTASVTMAHVTAEGAISMPIDRPPMDTDIRDAMPGTHTSDCDRATSVRAFHDSDSARGVSRITATCNILNHGGATVVADGMQVEGPPARRLRSRCAAPLPRHDDPPPQCGDRVRCPTRWMRVRAVVDALPHAAAKVVVASPFITQRLHRKKRARSVSRRHPDGNTDKGGDGRSRVLRPRHPVASSFSMPSPYFTTGSYNCHHSSAY